MDSPSDYHAEEGDWPPSRIVPFVRLVMRDVRKTFQGVRVNRTINGVHVVAESLPAVFVGAWPVTLSGPDTVRIGAGTVNGRVPWLAGRDLEGLDAEGTRHPEGIPLLSLESGPGERRRSYIGVVVTISRETGAMDVDLPESLTVAHRGDLPVAFLEGGAPDEETTGFWPLAQAQWSTDGKRVERVNQWAYFQYVHRFVAGEGTRPGRHFFRPG